MSELPFTFMARAALQRAALVTEDPDEATFLKRLADGKPLFLFVMSEGGTWDILGVPRTVEFLSADYCTDSDEEVKAAEEAEMEWDEVEEYCVKWLKRKAKMRRG